MIDDIKTSTTITLIAYGIAKEILGQKSTEMDISPNTNIGQLKKQLLASHPSFADLLYIKFAINEDYQEEDYEIQAGDEVVIIPPVSGG